MALVDVEPLLVHPQDCTSGVGQTHRRWGTAPFAGVGRHEEPLVTARVTDVRMEGADDEHSSCLHPHYWVSLVRLCGNR